MKTKTIIRSMHLLCFFLFISFNLVAQCVISSTDGYFVTVSTKPVQIIPASSSCEWGYSYNVRLEYDISFSGTNIPASLYTLQGTVNCSGTPIFFDLPNNMGTGSVISSTSYTSLTNCSNPTVSSLGCTSVQIEIEGPGIPAQTISCPISAALPVDFSSFEVKIENNLALLSWTTAWEENNAFFSVERSADGNNYTTIARINGKGNSITTNRYNYTDYNITPGSFYYRIRQTDLNGKFAFSDVRKVTLASGNRLTITPNPVPGNELQIQGLAATSKETKAQIFNTNGHLVHSGIIRGANMKLPSDLNAGNYVLILITDTGERKQLRFVKM